MTNIHFADIVSRGVLPALAGAIVATCLFTSTDGYAWEFESCSSSLTTSVDLRPPQAMIMLDRSGSMTYEIESFPRPNPFYGWVSSTMLSYSAHQPMVDYDIWAQWQTNNKSNFSYDESLNWARPDNLYVGSGVYQAKYKNQPAGTFPSYGPQDTITYNLPDGTYSYPFLRHYDWFNTPGSLWGIAVRELGSVLQSYDGVHGGPPKIKFGLGTFTTYVSPFILYGESEDWAQIWSEAYDYTNAADFMKFFEHPQQGGPYGSTPTQPAIDAMRLSSTISNQATSNAGILITDGEPNYAGPGYSNPYEAGITAACNHRQKAPLYVIGFSGGTDVAYNNLMAAAGGTGSCKVTATNEVIDACNRSQRSTSQLMTESRNGTLKCEGAYQADSGTEFRDALDAVTRQISCTYPLDVVNTPDGKAPADPAGTRVFLGQCVPGPGTHSAWGGDFNVEKSYGSAHTNTRAATGLACTNTCGQTNWRDSYLTYYMPTTPNEQNVLRFRVADYLHDCKDTIRVAAYVDGDPNKKIGEWQGSGTNDWAVVEFPFTPTNTTTAISIAQVNDYCCGCDTDTCTGRGLCDPHAADLNLYVDWVKVWDPKGSCAPTGGLNYVAPGSSGSGWTYNEDRTKVELVGGACTSVQNRQYESVTTQVACPCVQIEGGACNTAPGESCPVGTWQCTAQWEDICVPNTDCDLEECAPVTKHELRTGQPNVQLVVDNSGSMGWRIQDSATGNDTPGHTNEARHWIAKRVLADLASWSYKGVGCQSDGTNCDRLRLGIHFWSTSKKTRHSAAEDMTKSLIEAAFDNNRPSGGTDFHLAGELLRDEQALKDSNAANVGIMVTDGEPGGLATFKSDMEITCNIRKRTIAPVATYVLGFGKANAVKKNSAVAAAGGTGVCCYGTSCDTTNPNLEVIDPCTLQDESSSSLNLGAFSTAIYNNTNYNGRAVHCSGNIAAEDGATLKNELQALFQDLECTFPLTLLPDRESASSNPAGTRVKIGLANVGGLVSVPHTSNTTGQAQFVEQLRAKGVANADAFLNDGWKFANAGRTAIQFTQNICDQIQGRAITEVETQVCDACELEGNPCEVPCVAGQENCNTDEPLKDAEGNHLKDSAGRPLYHLYGRCRVGIMECRKRREPCSTNPNATCIKLEEVCVQDKYPIAEICNGIDDNCNGQIDDLSTNEEAPWSDPEWSFSETGNNGEYAALACYNQDVCACAGNKADGPFPDPEGADGPGQFEAQLAGQLAKQNANTNNCACGTGLADPLNSPSKTVPEHSQTDHQAACSISGTAHSNPTDAWWLLGIFGLVGAGRLTRRTRR